MVIINDDIIVKVSTPTFCDFYDKLHLYVNQLLDENDEVVVNDFDLKVLNVFTSGNTLNEEYVLSAHTNNKLYKISFISSLVTRTGNWTELIEINENDISFVRDIEHVYNMNDFIKNN